MKRRFSVIFLVFPYCYISYLDSEWMSNCVHLFLSRQVEKNIQSEYTCANTRHIRGVRWCGTQTVPNRI